MTFGMPASVLVSASHLLCVLTELLQGFFYIVNHSLSAADIELLFQESKRFFALPGVIPLMRYERVVISMAGREAQDHYCELECSSWLLWLGGGESRRRNNRFEGGFRYGS